MRVPWGNATGAERLQIRLYDLLAHGWDVEPPGFQPGCPTISPSRLWRPFGTNFPPSCASADSPSRNPSTTRPRLSNVWPHPWDARSDRNCKVWPSSRSVTARRICAKRRTDSVLRPRLENQVERCLRRPPEPGETTVVDDHFSQPPLAGLRARAPVPAARATPEHRSATMRRSTGGPPDSGCPATLSPANGSTSRQWPSGFSAALAWRAAPDGSAMSCRQSKNAMRS